MCALGYYLLSNLQWYNYKITRVVLHHYKPHWHILYFVLPVVLYYVLESYFVFYFYLAYLPSLLLWTYKLDKKLVFTGRVYRFVAILAAFVLLGDGLCFFYLECEAYPIFMPLAFTYLITSSIEYILLKKYAEVAMDKLQNMKDLKIICITGSYGKTSLKNYVHQLLEGSFKVYSTQRSVNTFAGLVSDINNNLPSNTQIYIAEAGARAKGDIAEIASLLNHEYAIIGKIGPAHIEYFKTIQNTIETKLEILQSKNLKKAFYYKENPAKIDDSRVVAYPEDIKNVVSNLDGLSFELKIGSEHHRFSCEILGEFNTINISGAIHMALELGVPLDVLKDRVKRLKPVEHRLNKIESKQKLIIDDSFNGNLEGMLEGVRLSSLYPGRKVIITPGIIESDEESNIKLAKAIDEVFDIIIITGSKNAETLKKHILKAQKIILKDKTNMQNILKAATKEGDLILFANDAPSFI